MQKEKIISISKVTLLMKRCNICVENVQCNQSTINVNSQICASFVLLWQILIEQRGLLPLLEPHFTQLCNKKFVEIFSFTGLESSKGSGGNIGPHKTLLHSS